MSTARKDVIAYASIIDPALCDGVVVKLITTQSTEQVCKTQCKRLVWIDSLKIKSSLNQN